MIYILLCVLTGILVIFGVYITHQTSNDILYIKREIQRNRDYIIKQISLYEDITSNLILPKSFLGMKNRGSSLCKETPNIPYIDYDIHDLFL